jgi:predicted esterase
MPRVTGVSVRRRLYRLAIVAGAFAVIGAVLIYFSSAASIVVAGEAESGVLGGAATVVDGQGASGGQAVRFAATEPSACQTGGTGGAFNDALDQAFSGAGLSSTYHLYAAGLPTNEPAGLLLYFHGDGAYEFKNPEYKLPGIVAHAKSKKMITMSMLSPDKIGDETWWEDGEANAEYVREFMQQVPFAKYNINKNKIWLVGYSGGAQFITQNIVADHSDLMCGGGSIVFGGGGRPTAMARPLEASFKQNFRMHWYTGLDDTAENAEDGYDAISDAQEGFAFYESQGMQVTSQWPPGVNHDNIPEAQIVGEQLQKYYP